MFDECRQTLIHPRGPRSSRTFTASHAPDFSHSQPPFSASHAPDFSHSQPPFSASHAPDFSQSQPPFRASHAPDFSDAQPPFCASHAPDFSDAQPPGCGEREARAKRSRELRKAAAGGRKTPSHAWLGETRLARSGDQATFRARLADPKNRFRASRAAPGRGKPGLAAACLWLVADPLKPRVKRGVPSWNIII